MPYITTKPNRYFSGVSPVRSRSSGILDFSIFFHYNQETMKQKYNLNVLKKTNVQRAFLTLVIPTVISQLIAVIYNMSDSFWIGQLNNSAQFAAAFICVPTFLFLASISNIFGIGGASLIARCLGKKDFQKARATCAFCLWTTIFTSLTYGVLFYIFRHPILHLIGATDETYRYCEQYAFWTAVVGAVPAALSGLFGHLIRAEGYAKQASFGMILGLVLNMILDPLFIFILGLEIVGAAVATVLAMCIGCAYFVYFILTRPDTSILTLNPKYYQAKNHILPEVLLVGLPSTLMTLMALISNVVANVLTASYSTAAIAGMGIAKRIDAVIFAITNGIGQGALPLISYNYAAKNWKRLRSAIKITFTYSLIVALMITACLFFSAPRIIHVFIQDSNTIAYGSDFLKILCLTCPFLSLTLIILTIFQALGLKTQPIILALVRKGGLDIPLMYFLNQTIGLMGIAWAFPIEDLLSALIACLLFLPLWQKSHLLKKKNCHS